MNKNKTVLLCLLISILTLSLIASTYAFVRLSTTNQNNFKASLKAGTMSLVFSDGSPGFNTQISLGGSVEKIFTIENTGQGETYATMSWRELQNTYTPGSLVYTLEESSDGGLNYTSRVNTTPVPTSNTGLTIAENLTIPTGTTMYYKLTISYIFLEGVNQTQDLRAYLNTLFTLEEGSFIDKAVLISKISSNYWSSSEYADKIKTITFTDNTNIPDDIIMQWDVSTAGDGRIMAYLINNEDSTEETPLYDLFFSTDRMQIYGNYNSNYTFYGLLNLESINNFEIFNTSGVAFMNQMFYRCESITNIDLSHFDTSNVTNMGIMFSECNSLTSLNVNTFDTTKVTNMENMFNSCSSLTSLDLSSFDTSNVTRMDSMFNNCNSLTNLNISSFNTSKVTTMLFMFKGCNSITYINLNNFDTSNVTSMEGMFEQCSSLTNLDLSSFDTSNVTNMSSMFYRDMNIINLDLSNFNTSNVTNMHAMFFWCYNLTSILVSELWNTSNVTDSYNMFYDTTNLIGGAGTTYNSSYIDASYAHVDEGPSNPGYLTLKV